MSGEAAYLESSALVKLAVREPESLALRRFLRGWPIRISSALVRREAIRAVMPQGDEAIGRARAILRDVSQIPIDDEILDEAALIHLPMLRSLDAIHLATAVALGASLGVLVTYDRRMREGAEALGLPLAAPG